MTRATRAILAMAMLATVEASCKPGPEACVYQGTTVKPQTTFVDGCMSCTCGIPGSPDQGLKCVVLDPCPDAGADGSSDGG